jgi:hypothetical protein
MSTIESQVSRSEIIKFKSNTPATYILILILVWKGTRPMYYLLTADILILILNSGVIGNFIEIRLLKKFSVCLSILISSQALSKVFWKLKIWPPPPSALVCFLMSITGKIIQHLSLNNSRFGDFGDRINPIELEIQDTTNTDRSASYLDLHHEIDSEGRL